MKRFIATFMRAFRRRQTQTIAILGDRRVGKTSLLQALFNEPNRPIATTRSLASNIPFFVRDFSDGRSAQDIRRDLESSQISLVLVVVRPTGPLSSLEEPARRWIAAIPPSVGDNSLPKRLLVATRGDEAGVITDSKKIKSLARSFGFSGGFLTSAKTNAGMQELRDGILGATPDDVEEEEEALQLPVTLIVRTMAEALCTLVAERPSILDHIEWRELERIVAVALEHLGFSVELTPPSKDGGKDVVARCLVGSATEVFYIEIKHWREGGRPGLDHIWQFVEVNAREKTNGGLFLSSSGYRGAVYKQIGKLSRQHIRLGDREKIVSLCQYYTKTPRSVLLPLKPLPELLFEETIETTGS
jgi:hypothetical protein